MKVSISGAVTDKKPISLLVLRCYPFLWHFSEGTSERNLKTGEIPLNDHF